MRSKRVTKMTLIWDLCIFLHSKTVWTLGELLTWCSM